MKIAFVSTMNTAPWGGSEVLWSEAALRLAQQGHAVVASLCGWRIDVPQVRRLRASGIRVKQRLSTPPSIRHRALRGLTDDFIRAASLIEHRYWLTKERPDLACISNASFADDIRMMNLCLTLRVPYVLIAHANAEQMWPVDREARAIIHLYRNALRTFFVSEANRELLETQLGIGLINAELVRNPFNVRWDAAPAWPEKTEQIRLACVGRLDPRSKGQDILLRVLAAQRWQSRPVSVSFFGAGEMEEGLRRLARHLQLSARAQFCGTANDVQEIWAQHHALVLPSRYEGLPLVVVEAMLCGRPVIATDIGGNSELIEDGVSGFVAEAPTVRHFASAMERAWQHRQDWEQMGRAAARAVRAAVPVDPAAEFAKKLLYLAVGKSDEQRSRHRQHQ